MLKISRKFNFLYFFFLVPYFFFSSTQAFSTLKGQECSPELNAYFEKFFEERLSRRPQDQTLLGRKTNYHLLNSLSDELQQQEHLQNKKALRVLASFPFDQLCRQDQLSYKIFKRLRQQEMDLFPFRHYNFPVNQMFGLHSEIVGFMINAHRIQSLSDARDYISRLQGFPTYFRQLIRRMKTQSKMGLYPPSFIFDYAYQDLTNILTGIPFDQGPQNSPLLEDFLSKLSTLPLEVGEHAQLESDIAKALLEQVRPAMTELFHYLKKNEDRGSAHAGVWRLPQGEKYYQQMLIENTQTNLSAQEIHQLGLKEVARIHQEMRELIKNKLDFSGDLRSFFHHVLTNPDLKYEDTEAGRAGYLMESRLMIDRITQRLPELFNLIPVSPMQVKAVESFREKSAGLAFYEGPSEDGSRPGVFYVNLFDMSSLPKTELEALAYHEGIPGHHMQISLSTEMKELPQFRRQSPFTSYVEGWGLYAELLPKEIGFYQNPYSDFGRLSMELWRAARLVVDTGIHAQGWSKEKAIAYLDENTPSPALENKKAIERYSVMPGQATSYKIGMLKILELRELAQKSLGERFDIREFHDQVLGYGALPLDILEEVVREWIDGKLK